MYQRLLTAVLAMALIAVLTIPVKAESDDAVYSEQRELSVDIDGVNTLRIDAGAGRLEVKGVEGGTQIAVRAHVLVYDANPKRAREYVADDLQLSLERAGGAALLESGFDGRMGFGGSGVVHLEVQVPRGLELEIDKGSGSTLIEGTASKIRIDDGSGSLQIRDSGALHVDDGSGSLRITDAAGDVYIDDGSGSIRVSNVSGNLTVDDGSGSITVRDIQGDFMVVDDGSGSVNYTNVAGSVDIDD